MTILITNTVLLNGGDAAVLHAMLRLLREAFGEHVRYIIYDTQPDVAARYYPDLTLRQSLYGMATRWPPGRWFGRLMRPLHLLRFYVGAWCWAHGVVLLATILLRKCELDSLAEYRSADLIVSTGGTYLVEQYPLRAHIFDYNISLLMRRPLLFFTQSLGPFVNWSNQRALRRIFNRALLILLRDEASLQHLRRLNVSGENVRVSADPVFVLSGNRVVESASSRYVRRHTAPQIAMSVRQWPYFKTVSVTVGMERFQNAFRAVTRHLIEKRGADITYISTCQGIPEYWADDSALATAIIASLPERVRRHIRVDRNFHRPEELFGLLRSYEMVIATRLHMGIMALAAGVPVLPVAYEFKTEELFKRLGLTQWVQQIETIDADAFTKVVDSFLDSLPDIHRALEGGVARERTCALESAAILKQAFAEQHMSRT